MGCELFLNIGGTQISLGEIDIDNEEGLTKASLTLADNIETANVVIKHLKETKLGMRALNVEDLVREDGSHNVIGNRTVGGLFKQFPNLNKYKKFLNKDQLNKFNVLLVDAPFNINGNNMLGVTKMAKEGAGNLFIIRNNYYAVEDFLKYYVIENSSLSLSQEASLQKVVDFVADDAEWSNLNTTKKVLNKYIVSYAFRSFIDNNLIAGVQYKNVISNIVNKLLNLEKEESYEINENTEDGFKISFVQEFINNLSKSNQVMSMTDVGAFMTAYNEHIKPSELPDLEYTNPDDVRTFIQEMNLMSPYKIIELESLADSLIVFKSNPKTNDTRAFKRFNEFSLFNDLNVLVEPISPETLADEDFPDLGAYEAALKEHIPYQDNYKGYKIYRINSEGNFLHNKFIISIADKSQLSIKNEHTKIYNSLKEATKAINAKAKNPPLSKIGLKLNGAKILTALSSKNNLNVGDTIPSIDVKISNTNIKLPREFELILNTTSFNKQMEILTDIYPLHNFDVISNFDKLEALLYLSQEIGIEEALNTISNATYKYFTIISVNYSDKNIIYELVENKEVGGIIAKDNKKNKDGRQKQVKEMISIVNSLTNTPINLITKEDIDKDSNLKKITGLKNKSAFIINSQIYVNLDNATKADVMHEFLHIFLGSMKSNKLTKESYYNLVNKIQEHPEYEELLKNFDKDPRALTDKNEEIFVDLLAKYISLRQDDWFLRNADGTFHQNLVKSVQNSIHGTNTFNLDVLNMDINEIFASFSKISMGNNFSEFIDNNHAAKYRQATNRIAEGIKKGEIEENCD